MADTWLSYSNQGATRSQPIAPDLVEAMSFLADMGVAMDVYSGGQPSAGNGARVGSTRHDHGNAADVTFRKDGRTLDWNNESDLPILSDIIAQAKASGVTGIGAGDDYMGPGRFHVGFGEPSVWGAGGRSSNAPEWLKLAYAGSPAPIMRASAQPPAKQPNFLQAAIGGIRTGIGGLAQQARPTVMRAAQRATPAIMQAALGTVAGRTGLIEPGLKNIMTGSPSGSRNTQVVQSYRDQGNSPSQSYDMANAAAVERAIAGASNPEQARRLNSR